MAFFSVRMPMRATWSFLQRDLSAEDGFLGIFLTERWVILAARRVRGRGRSPFSVASLPIPDGVLSLGRILQVKTFQELLRDALAQLFPRHERCAVCLPPASAYVSLLDGLSGNVAASRSELAEYARAKIAFNPNGLVARIFQPRSRTSLCDWATLVALRSSDLHCYREAFEGAGLALDVLTPYELLCLSSEPNPDCRGGVPNSRLFLSEVEVAIFMASEEPWGADAERIEVLCA